MSTLKFVTLMIIIFSFSWFVVSHILDLLERVKRLEEYLGLGKDDEGGKPDDSQG